jgi:ribose 5-phosphate isomerase A
MNPEQLKALVGRAALQYVVPGALVGVGTGSTANHFIDALAEMRDRIAGAVSSSDKSTERLRGHGIRVLEAAEVQSLPVYIDGADESGPQGPHDQGRWCRADTRKDRGRPGRAFCLHRR